MLPVSFQQQGSATCKQQSNAIHCNIQGASQQVCEAVKIEDSAQRVTVFRG